MQVKIIAECSSLSILQYFRPLLFAIMIFVLSILSSRVEQVLLYPHYYKMHR